MPRFGEDHYNATLTDDDIRLIRGMVEERRRLKEQLKQLTDGAIAEKFEVNTKTVNKIANFQIWKHVR